MRTLAGFISSTAIAASLAAGTKCARAEGTTSVVSDGDTAAASRSALIKTAVGELLKMQEPDGDWPYEGVYRVAGQIPVGYRIGGTALVCEALLHGAEAGDREARAAMRRGVGFIVKKLDDPLMTPSTRDAYDVRVWGHAYALDLFCQLRAGRRMGVHGRAIERWIPKLVAALIEEELPGGGWNYANRRQHAPFVTAPVVQALLLARSQGEAVPDDILKRSRKVLEGSRLKSGAFVYSGTTRGARDPDGEKTVLPGAIARSPVSETTLTLLGGGSIEAVRASLAAFHEHWGELEKRRKKTGTHVPPYGVAPYYFYYGHRYAAQAIEALPPEERAAQRDRLLEVILRTRDADGTWNDRVFERSRNFGTAMVVLALLGDRPMLPQRWIAPAKNAASPTTSPSLKSGNGPSQ